MPEKSAKGIDRRDLIVASVATVGSAAAVAVDASTANAQAADIPPSIRHQERSILAMLSKAKR